MADMKKVYEDLIIINLYSKLTDKAKQDNNSRLIDFFV